MALSYTSEKFPYNFGAATLSSSPDAVNITKGKKI